MAQAPATATAVSDFSRLSRRIRQAGLLDRRPRYYLVRLSAVTGLHLAGVAAFFLLGDSWLQVPLAALLAIVFAQVALVLHDLAHRQIFTGRRPSEVLGLLGGNLAIGLGYGWWMNKHTRHHANPNHEDLDPDVVPDVLVCSQEQARVSRGLARLIGGRQALLFYPLLLLEGLNLHVSGLRALRRPWLRHRVVEGALLLAHFVLYLGALAWVLSPGKALVFFAVHQGLFGLYMGCVFAPGHKGMPTLTGKADLDFLRKQVLTTRNVRGGRFVDLAMGGLNYQIEHHLFPHMPTPNLRKARPIVRAYCRRLGLPYHEVGFLASHGEALRHLHHAGAPLREKGRP
ncbi:fatty acid desaturase family protein [Nonomuraea rhodomycinica]|uniref:Acyl-CoA desaturase n=1 Tax=Nonomuraea rhodomycinica TaxID=1712872 RepID=A0A7Y6IK77_9ACTN|nr:acyl-CoA desaturase [Nonomuraea rhodomycinica]NUW39546.1 acyl-CoA desaturase [Nonomuraea rhodomycinica]